MFQYADAELAQRLQHEDDSSGEYRQEQGTNKSTCSSKDYKQALLVHNQQLLNHGSVHSSVEQDEKLTAVSFVLFVYIICLSTTLCYDVHVHVQVL